MKKGILLVLLGIGLNLSAADYTIDTTHSHVMFKIKHLAISTVTGRFDTFKGEFSFDPENFEKAGGWVTIETASINTDVDDRDKHLRSEDFFHVEKYPTMRFESTAVERVDDKHFKLIGNLEMHGVTKPVTLDVEYAGMVKDPWGNTRVAFNAEGKLNRKDYGLTWNKLLETGGLVVGEEVRIVLEIQAIQKKENNES